MFRSKGPTPIPFAALAWGALTVLSGCSNDDNPAGGGDASVPPAYAKAAECGVCHPDQFEEWLTSMHAFSGVDPLMLRLSEMAAEDGGEIGRSCQNCHAPAQKRYELVTGGSTQDDFSEDGLNCDVCHSISEVPPVGSITFLDEVDPSGPKYANMPETIPTEAHESERRHWYSTSIACAPCHQVDLPDGSGLENTFIEWEAANLSGMGIECQTCHMPTYTGRAAVDGPVRENLHRHKMTGVDYVYDEFRGIDTAQQKEDIRQLLENSVTVSVADMPTSTPASSSFTFSVTVFNDRTGHSIPSGVSFAREMWVEVVVRDQTGAIAYESGALDAADNLVADSDLTFFGAQMYDSDGEPTPFAWRAASIDESLLLPYLARRTADYTIPVPEGATSLTVDLALRFRSLAPQGLRDIGLDEILPIEIFDMWKENHEIAVTPG